MIGEVRIDPKRKWWHDTFKSTAGFAAFVGGLQYLGGADPTAAIIWTVMLFVVACNIKFKWVKQGEIWQRR